MWILKPGDLFDQRYRIQREIGAGGMAYVYAAVDEELQDTVALKVIKPELVNEKELVERFKREVRIARQINHPNIVRIFEFGRTQLQDKTFYYLTMELLKGVDLGTWLLTRGSITLNETVEIGIQLCEALRVAHGQGVVHRDIKPQNIFIDEDGRATLMDFGISRLATLTGLTSGSQLMGTPRYMSPEQVSGRKRELDHRSDIYSVGIVLYELCTMQVPFGGETPVEIALRHVQEAPKPPRDVNAKVSPALEKIIMTCLEKDPASRYGSAAELGAALQAVAQDVGIETQAIPSLQTGFEEKQTAARSIEAPVAPAQKEAAPAPLDTRTPTAFRRGVTIRTKAKNVRWFAGSLIGLAVVGFVGLLLAFALREPPREPVLLDDGATSGEAAETPLLDARDASGKAATSTSVRGGVAENPGGPIAVSISASNGTKIYFDGEDLGIAPVEIETTEGKHRIRYVIPGYGEHEASVDVRRGRDNSFSHTFPSFGILRVVCQPYASVRLDGKDVGYTPINLEKVQEGDHQIVLYREGYETIEETVTVHPDQINLFPYTLVRR
jgi:hypothetical protein